MQYLSKKITDYIVKVGVVSKESYAIYQYGFQIAFEMLSCFLTSLIIAIYMHMIIEFVISTVIFIFLRTYAGGIHLNSFIGCFICSTVVQTMVLLLYSRYTVILPVSWIIILGSSFLILMATPVENINRELDEDEKQHCKKMTIKVLAGVVIFSGGCMFFNMNNVVSLAALTVLVVLIAQYLGILKYNIEKKRQE